MLCCLVVLHTQDASLLQSQVTRKTKPSTSMQSSLFRLFSTSCLVMLDRAEHSGICVFPLVGNLACPGRCGCGWIHSDNTHGTMAIIINVPLDSRLEVEQVTIYARFFIVGLPGATPLGAPVVSVDNVNLACTVLVIQCL